MAIKIISQTEKPLLSRTKVVAHITFEAVTPSNEEVKKQLAAALKKDEKVVVIKKISTSYGSKEADIDAVFYDSEEDLKKVEKKTRKQKRAEAEAAKKKAESAEKAKEEKKEEKSE